MNLFNLRLINFRKNILNISIFISLLIHILTILSLNKNTNTSTKGDKFIPIELINTDSFAGRGESLIKEIKKDKLKFKKEILESKNEEKIDKSDKEEILESKNGEKIDKSDKKEINKIVKENINKNSSDQTQIKKQLGNKSNNKENNVPEKGSVKGKSKIEITCLRCIRPNYPTRALRRGAEGKPLVKVWINKIGNVTKSELIKSSGNDSIDKAALLAANKSTFFPISIDTTLQIEYDLKIRK